MIKNVDDSAILPSTKNILINHAWMVAFSSAAVFYLAANQTVEEVEINDIMTWRSGELVKGFNMEEYANVPLYKTFKFLGLDIEGRRYVPQYAIDSESESIKPSLVIFILTMRKQKK